MAVDMFIKIGDIKGESRDAKHKDEIDVLSWSWGMSQSGSMHVGGGGGAGRSTGGGATVTRVGGTTVASGGATVVAGTGGGGARSVAIFATRRSRASIRRFHSRCRLR